MKWQKNDELQHTLAELELIGDRLITVGVPKNSPVELKIKVLGAAKSYIYGNKSVDYTIKRYGKDWDFPEIESEDILFSRLSKLIKVQSENLVEKFLSIECKSNSLAVFACTAAIYRLKNSFLGAAYCMNSYLHFETVSISRMILEQIAWMYAICEMDDDRYQKARPQQCITKLKEILPDAGRAYGALSESSHIHFEQTLHYVKVENETIKLDIRNRKLSVRDGTNLIALLDYLGIVGEYIYRDYIQEYDFVMIADEKIVANPNRQFLKVIEEANLIESKIFQARD